MSGRLLTAPEAAELLSVNPRWLLAQARARRVPHHRLGRQVRFAREHVDAILAGTLCVPVAADSRAGNPTAGRDPGRQAPSQEGALAVPLPAQLYPLDARRRARR